MLNFQAALLNVNFEADYKNVLRFDNREAQENYFNCASLFVNAPSINFNASNLFETVIDYTLPEGESITELLSKNYCIIKDNSSTKTYNYYYYFITNAYQNSGTQIRLELELDVFNTYYIDVEFTDCQILRAHLNRWVDNGNGTISFDSTMNSPLFERENIKANGLRTTTRSFLNLYNYSISNTAAANWLNENIVCWQYIFVAPKIDSTDEQGNPTSSGYTLPLGNGSLGNKAVFFDQTYLRTGADNSATIGTGLTAIAIPVFKGNKKIVCKIGNYTLQVQGNALYYFTKQNEGYSYIYTTKASAMPPFFNLPSSFTYKITDNGNELDITCNDWQRSTSIGGNLTYGLDFGPKAGLQAGTKLKAITDLSISNNRYIGAFYVAAQDPAIKVTYKNAGRIRTYDKSFIAQDTLPNLPDYEPKLLNSDYYNLKIGTPTSSFDYDVQKLRQSDIEIYYTEPLTPDITKTYTRYAGQAQSIYLPLTSQNFTGDVSSNDTSLIQTTSQYQSMLANNKNYFLQNSINRATSLIGAGVGVAANIAQQNYGTAVLGGIGGIMQAATNKINEGLTVDNMRSAPASIQNARGNALLEIAAYKLGPVVEEQNITLNEMYLINDYLSQYGYSYNRVGNIKDFDNIRSRYNYVQALLQEVKGVNISRKVHETLTKAFERGVRFWNKDDFSYKYQNYENWLKEG